MMDFYPTAARLADTSLPSDRTIDGHDLGPCLDGGPETRSPYDDAGFFYYMFGQLQAVRSERWKLYLPLEDRIVSTSQAAAPAPLELYDLETDIAEQYEVSGDHADVVDRLLDLAEDARADLGDEDRQGADQRPAGWVENPTYQAL